MLKAYFNKLFFNLGRYYSDWLDRRIPSEKSITLNHKKIFILPTKQGYFFLLLLCLMLLIAINYQNNMIFALIFFLSSLFVVSILHTYANLSGLVVTWVKSTSAFSGENVEFQFSLLARDNRQHLDVIIFWPDSEKAVVSFMGEDAINVNLDFPSVSRGILKPPRVRVETIYPLGLLKAWTWLELGASALVFPKPVAGERNSMGGDSTEYDGAIRVQKGADEYDSFKPYQAGDSLKHVLWRSYAKGQGLNTIQYAAYQDQRVWIKWDQFIGGVEQRLEYICYWVLHFDNQGIDYGVSIPGFEVAPSNGDAHRLNVLKALALFSKNEGRLP
ncbi:DUF58 domain-containing protein [bacterium]|nr:DUF58 domain-containing protein [bacterium]